MPFPVTVERIEQAEQQLGRRLPDPLRERLLRDDGGELEAGDDDWELLPVFDDTDRKRIARTANHVARETRLARQSARFPSGAIAIASDGSGNYLVLPAESDEISRWDHETGAVTPVDVGWD